ncbi:zinc fingers and homeoboxes protein 1 isoform X1 [Astyanax mexicanus]|uniref:zinc fingers and homeoboxes protein 1 isoform X1 n=1 Tax=Astyanax mexicanus TaxID=7994 RepID=UPI0020CAFCEF|nr:zinc fingers and homeoboxes protein 1 isoform X1 [Astyanax mexicanus]XP_007242155.2 zinc fingers and homeoboxes protein 1 isoform X1 [Astyanax mexicanus]XP_007242156.2 zinc fingers and homeoboxes protein 1 isoform X1 [Astyanax mexicanus]XP_022518383.2 zinc fingers and homeoboxes protein 1 isoform X1 [Astyanax mexicanus]
MSSRRKSTTPCMVLPSDVVEQDPDIETLAGEEGAETAAESPAEGAAVPMETEGGEDHEDSVSHSAGKRPSQTTVEQSATDLTTDASFAQPETEESEDPSVTAISLSKTPIMKKKSKPESKRIAVSLKGTDESDALVESEGDPEPMEASVLGASITADMMNPVSSESAKPGLLVSIPNPVSSEQKKPVLNPAAVLPAGLAQVLSALQAQQSAQAQLLIPLSSIPTYNAAMDSNALLVNTYKKFPYPSASEIMGLAAQTKFSEEQIKIWFSAQRLKHGVSWTPEEVEEARRKQFNGTVHTVPQTITVIPAHHLSATNGLQSILQTCQIVGQPGLVLTQVGTANSLPVTTPITLTVAGMPHQSQAPKIASNQTSPAISETKRATTVQPPSLTPQENSALISDHFGLRPKKSKEQLAELKASYLKNHFASDAEIARLMKLTNLTKGEIKKWFSDTRYNQRNSKNNHYTIPHDGSRAANSSSSSATIIIDSSDETPQSPTTSPIKEKETRSKTWNPFPDFTLQKFKEKTPEQLVILEESYQKCDTPSDEELSRLRAETKLTRREIDAWFTEKRKTPVPESAEKNDGAEGESSQGKHSQTPPGAKKMVKEKLKKTPEQLHVLKSAFVRSQWPSTEEYDQLSEESGLPRPYIVNWFGDTRYAWKNGNLKWYFYYQSGNVEGMNGNKGRKRRIRNRGWGRSRSRKAKKSTNLEKPPPIKFKTGKDILKEYYLKHKFLNEQDLDELVAKSNMSYEQVREWFAEVCRKVDMGADPFDDNVNNEQEEEESQGENEIVGEEQGPSAPGEEEGEEDEEEEDDETDDSESWEPPQSVRKTLSGSEDQ